jgi:hypothetical protein
MMHLCLINTVDKLLKIRRSIKKMYLIIEGGNVYVYVAKEYSHLFVTYTPGARQRPRNKQLYTTRYWVISL